MIIIEYYAHNWRYCDFIPSEALILARLGHFYTRWTQYITNGSPATPQMTYKVR
eukprot:UN07399